MADWVAGKSESETSSGEAPAPREWKAMKKDELKSDKGGWARKASRVYTPVLETVGMAGGGAGGALLGAPAGPLAAGAGAVTGAGIGTVAGRKFAAGLDVALGADKTPEERAEGGYDLAGDVGAFTRGAAGEMGGAFLNKLLYMGSKIHRPSVMANRMAGRVLSEAETPVSPQESAIISRQRGFRPEDVQGAMRRQNISALPKSDIYGTPKWGALESLIGKEEGSSLLPILDLERKAARETAVAGAEKKILVEPKAAEIARTKISAFNADVEAQAAAEEARINSARQAAAERINTTRKLEAEKAAAKGQQFGAREAQAIEKQFADDFERTYGQSLVPKDPNKTPLQEMGQNIQTTLERAKKTSQERFNLAYNDPKFTDMPTAPDENPLTSFVANEKPPIGFSASGDPERKIATLLNLGGEKEVAEGAAEEAVGLSYGDLREISSAAGKASRANANNRPVADYFNRLKSAAEQTIKESLESYGGKELAEEYGALNRVFDAEQIAAYRSGTGRTILRRGGTEAGHKAVEAGDIPKIFQNEGNVRDLIRAYGVEKLSIPKVDPMTVSGEGLAAARAATLKGFSEAEIMAAGKQEAADMLRPYFQRELAIAYQEAGGGAAGAKKVSAWLNKQGNIDNLKQLGLYDEFAAMGKRAGALEKNLGPKSEFGSKLTTDVQKYKKAEVVRNTLKIDDPLKIYNYAASSGNVRSAVADLMRVSPSAEYRSAVKSLMRDGVQADMENGINPWNPELAGTPEKIARSKRVRELLPQIYSKSELRVLKDVHIIFGATEPRTTFGIKPDATTGGVVRKLGEDINVVPAVGKYYWAKRAALFSLKKAGLDYDAAAVKVLNDALTGDVSKAQAVIAAYKRGETGAFRKFVQKAYENDKFNARFSRRLPAAATVSGAAEYARGPRPEPENTVEPAVEPEAKKKSWGQGD